MAAKTGDLDPDAYLARAIALPSVNRRTSEHNTEHSTVQARRDDG